MSIALVHDISRHREVSSGRTGRLVSLCCSVIASAALAGTLVYAVGFLGSFPVPKDVNTGGGNWSATVGFTIDIELIGLFALQHSGLAQSAFKQALHRFVSPDIASGTNLLCSSLALALLFFAWQPLPAVVWQASNSQIVAAIQSLSLLGWLMVLYSAFLLRHFGLSRLKQAPLSVVGRPPVAIDEATRLYRFVRHPLYVGFAFACWSAPTMTAGHFLLATAATLYICFGIWREERDLAVRVAVGQELTRRRTSFSPSNLLR